MASVTYHVVVPFDRNAEGDLVPSEGAEVPTAGAAARRARAMVPTHAGAVAFSRTGNPATGEFQDAVVIVSVGEVDLDALTLRRPELGFEFGNAGAQRQDQLDQSLLVERIKPLARHPKLESAKLRLCRRLS